MARESIQIAIYLLGTSHFDAEMSNAEIINSMVAGYNANLPRNERFTPQALNTNFDKQGLEVRVFYAKKNRAPKWTGFLAPLLDERADLLSGKNKDVSFVSFIYNDDYIFAISGGQGNFMIQEYINTHFGIELLSRLISENSQVIKSLTDRGITGSILGSQRFFRFDYRLTDDQEFGKLYKQIKAALDPNILVEKFGFSEDEIKKNIGCIAKSTFQINKSISITFLLSLINRIIALLQIQPNFEVNSLQIIVNKGQQNKIYISELDNELFESIASDIVNDTQNTDVDICHYDFDKYLLANSYKVFKRQSVNPINDTTYDWINLDTLRSIVLDNFAAPELHEVREFLKSLRIISYDADGSRLTDGYLGKHLHGEIEYDNNQFFYLDGDWYKVQASFIENINVQCREVIRTNLDNTILTEAWDTQAINKENFYNQLYFPKTNFLVFDKVLSSNIEICDVLKYTDNTLYFVHVKKGFNNTVRDLSSQVFISAKYVQQSLMANDYTPFEELYNGLRVRTADPSPYSLLLNEQANSITREQFIQLIRTRKDNIVFCLAFLDTAAQARNIVEINTFDSNIAKYSVVELHRKLRNLNISLKINQISKTATLQPTR